MATLDTLTKYIDYEFSSGCFTGEDYKVFQTKYVNYLKALCKDNDLDFVKANKSHYCFSCFMKRNDGYVYLSISDVRFFPNEWYNHILVRMARSETDYTGGNNNYTTLPNLMRLIEFLI